MRLMAMFIILSSAISHAYAADWTYAGDDNGEEEWGNISPAYVTCAEGKEQSPVQISFTTPAPQRGALEISYQPTLAHVERNEESLRVVMEESKSTIVADAVEYILAAVEFHTPSEHIFRGDFFMAEARLVHRSAEGRSLILAAFVNIHEANPAMYAVLDHADDPMPFSFDPSPLLPQQRGYFAYRGSLTYPPCTEGVEWRIFQQPITFSVEQVRALGAIVGRNSRLTQPLYLRTIEEVSVP